MRVRVYIPMALDRPTGHTVPIALEALPETCRLGAYQSSARARPRCTAVAARALCSPRVHCLGVVESIVEDGEDALGRDRVRRVRQHRTQHG